MAGVGEEGSVHVGEEGHFLFGALEEVSRVVGEDVDNKVYKLLHFAGSERDIADPWYTGNFDVTYDDVMEGCSAILEYCKKNEL